MGVTKLIGDRKWQAEQDVTNQNQRLQQKRSLKLGVAQVINQFSISNVQRDSANTYWNNSTIQ